MDHEHCDNCFLTNCLQTASCPLIGCPNGCFAFMHKCKAVDHQYICPNVFVPCLNSNYGCPLNIRRSDLTRHLRICPASFTICSFVYNHNYQYNNLNINSENRNFIEQLAYRDNIWSEHLSEFEIKHQQMYKELYEARNLNNQVEAVIRSEKYPYITMPECMLSRGGDVMCSTCRKHLRQLEENEDERLSQLTEEERKQHYDSHFLSAKTTNSTTDTSLVQMSSTLVDSSSFSLTETTVPRVSNSQTNKLKTNPLMLVISDIETPASFIYRLNYFSSNKCSKTIKSFNEQPRYFCHAFCRRDEIEHHWNIHLQVDCILNTLLVQKCPKSQYGCTFQSQYLEPCRPNGEKLQLVFDESNDAIAFQWHSTIMNELEQNHDASLINLPTEILTEILCKLDSLSLRNVSLVCHRLRILCQSLLPSRGIIAIEYERTPLSHGDITWRERKKHWLFTNTCTSAPRWELATRNKSTSVSQHIMTCPHGEKKDLTKEPPFALLAWNREKLLKPT